MTSKQPNPYTLRLGDMNDEVTRLHAKYAKAESKHSFIRRALRYALDNYREWVKR